jgi:TolB-like protein
MPFREPDAGPASTAFGSGLTRDIITRLAKLRALHVIAQGSVFALAERGVSLQRQCNQPRVINGQE